jgi:hypothetical protein
MLFALLMPLAGWLGAPVWVWGACFMVGFVLLSALTMALVRVPVRNVPPPWSPPAPREGDEGSDPMAEWKMVRLAPDQLTGEMWVDALQGGDIVAKIGPGDTASFMGTTAMSVRVLVPEERLDEAAALLNEAFGPAENGA